jgi:Tol biopolymer transport system component
LELRPITLNFIIDMQHSKIVLALLLTLVCAVAGCVEEPEPAEGSFTCPKQKVYLFDGPMDLYPSVSPDGSTIAYYHAQYFVPPRADDYVSGLYLINSDGTNRRYLAADGLEPAWSPDGQWIAFTFGSRLAKIKPNGDSLTFLPLVGGSFFPAWSPDGRKIAFDSNYNSPRGAAVLWTVNADFTGAKNISQVGVGEWRQPSWSKNGKSIYFVWAIDKNVVWEVCRIDSNGGPVKRVFINPSQDEGDIEVSPDGKLIMWRPSPYNIATMDTSGKNQRCIIAGNTPSWFPDNNTIVFSWPNSTKTKELLWKARLDGSGLTQLTF